MKVFVTGASGFIGKAVLKNLVNNHYEVTALLLPGEPENQISGTAIVRGDVTQPDTLSGKMDGHNAVIHLAGAVGYQGWKTCIIINKNGTMNVVQEAVNSGIRRFIHMSSVSVYGRIPNISIEESFPMKKIGDPYGDTKIDAESIVSGYASKGMLDLTIIRSTAVYGEGDEKFLPKLIESLKSGRFRIIGNGQQSVDLIHVRDVADGVLRVLKEKKSIGKIYNLANPHNPTWNEMLKTIILELGIPMPDKYISYRFAYYLAGMMEFISRFTRKPPRLNRYSIRLVGRQYNYRTDKIRNELGFTPTINLLDGIREYVKEMKKSSHDHSHNCPLS